jgi:hypothetical protein
MSTAELELLWENHSTAITVVLVLLFLTAVIRRGGANLRRFEELQAERRVAAANLGFKALGTEQVDSTLDAIAASVADGPERFGRFPRFAMHPRVSLQFKGERHGLELTVFSHRTDFDDRNAPHTTCAFFASPAIDVPEFHLKPSFGKYSPQVEAALDFIGKGFAKVFGPSDPEIHFPERPGFEERYTLTSTFTVRIRDAFPQRALEFFEAHPGWTVEGMNGKLLIYRNDVEEPPERIGGFVSEATAVAEVFRKSV